MQGDLEARLRAAVNDLPGPDAAATARARSRLPAVPRPRARKWVATGLGGAAVAALVAVLVVLLVNAPSDGPRPAAPHWQPGDLVVPDLRGLRTGEVARRMRELVQAAADRCAERPAGCPDGRVPVGLQARVAAAQPSDAPVGTALEQAPPPGALVAPGTYVRLTVSRAKGPGPSERPVGPGFTLPLLNRSGTAGLHDRAGSVTVLLFAASWCEPCRDALSDLDRIPPDDSVMLVVTGDLADDARKVGMTGLVDRVLDEDGSVARAYGVTALPTRVVIDRAGRVAATLPGSADPAELGEIVTAVRAEEPPSLDPSQATPLGLSGLPAPVDPADVPEAFLANGACEIDPRRVWMLAEGRAGTRLYVAQGPRVPLATGGAGGPGGPDIGFGCSHGPPGRAPLFRYGATPSFTQISYGGRGSIQVATAIVADGWTEATVAGTRIPIEHNGLVIDWPVPKGTVVRFTGPAGTADARL